MLLNDFSELVNQYDGFLIDQWGVLHDGLSLYVNVLERLHELNKKQKKIILLSNSGKPSHFNSKRLEEMGIKSDLYDEFVTSGEVAFQMIKSKENNFFKQFGNKCMAFVRGGDTEFLSELDLDLTSDLDKASFLLLSGVNEDLEILEKFRPILEKSLEKKLPLVCTNPDLFYLYGNKYYPGTGEIARIYSEMGGSVLYIGKPHKEIYHYALQKIGVFNLNRVLMIGDSFADDIKGANNIGIDSVLISGGLHSEDIIENNEINLNSAKKLFKKYEVTPSWITKTFG